MILSLWQRGHIMEADSLYGYFPSNLSSLFSISVIRWSWYAVYSVCSGCECAGRCFCAFKCSPCSAGPSASLPHLLHFTINNSKRRQLFICYLLMTRLDHLLILTLAGINKVQSNNTVEYRPGIGLKRIMMVNGDGN